MAKAKAKPKPTYALPTERKEVSNSLLDYNILIAGEKKTGKTAFCSQFPDHFILEFEAGNAKHLDCNYEDCLSYDQTMAYLDLLKAAPDYCRTLILDDVYALYYLCIEKTIEALKLDPTDKFGFDEWGYNRKLLANIITKINRLPIGKIYTCHTTNKLSTTRAGKEFTRLEPNYILSKQLTDVFELICPFHFGGVLIFNEDSKREMVIEGDDKIFAFNGFENHFLRPDGKRMKMIPMGSSPAHAYKNFMASFNNVFGKPMQKTKATSFSMSTLKSGV